MHALPARIVFLLPLFAAPLPAAFRASPQDERATRIADRCRAELEAIHARSTFPGGSAALVLPDGTVVTFTAGMASKEDEREMRAENRMLSGSVGKTYVTAAAHMLAARGKLDFDAKAASFFDDEPEWVRRVPNAADVTVRQLLRHQSGIPRYVFERALWEVLVKEKDKVWEPAELLAYVFDKPALFAAGEGWAYADTNYIIVGMIIEKVSGTTFYEFVRENVLEPHGLKDTVPSDKRRIPGLVQGYAGMTKSLGMPDRMIEDGQFAIQPQFEWCGGGYANTPTDLARWARILYSGELFDGEYLGTMLDAVPVSGFGPGVGYGLGVFVRETELGALLGHEGIFPGYATTMGYFPDVKIAGAFQINEDGPRAISMPLEQALLRFATIAAEELER